MKHRALVAALPIGLATGLAVKSASAHGFGERYDLPVPLNFFLVGAGATVALSFVVIGLFMRRRPVSSSFHYPRYNLLRPTWPRHILTGRTVLRVVRVGAVSMFGLIVATALVGTDRPIENLSPTMVWIIWWVGMGYVSVMLGNVWMLVNPWKITFEWAQAIMGGPSSTRRQGMFPYPERLDIWPAVAVFVVFAWLESVYSDAAQPQKLGSFIVLYSLVTWSGMAAFGKHQWLRRGEAFTVLFGFFARFSPTEVRSTDTALCGTCDQGCSTWGSCVDCYECFEAAEPDGRELNVRPYAVGLARPGEVSAATAVFVLLALATVTFDGLTATSAWVDFQTAVYSTAELVGTNTVQTIDTAGLLLLPLVFIAVYLGFSWAIRELSGERVAVQDVARAFVFSLVPIALAYNMAHFISLLLIQGQLIIPLASDPFGSGWDLFGSADYRLNIGVINARITWFISVGAIVLGHIISVYVAHVVSIRRTLDHSRALRSQYPMLVLMVFYTATSLWIIAQPIVSESS